MSVSSTTRYVLQGETNSQAARSMLLPNTILHGGAPAKSQSQTSAPQNTTPIIEYYEASDIPAIISLIERFHDEAPFGDEMVQISHERLRMDLLSRVGSAISIGLVARPEPRGPIVGFCLFQLTRMWFTENYYSQEIMLYVEKSHRAGGRIFHGFMRRVDDWSKRMQSIGMQVGTATGIETERVERLYQRLGYERVGALYRKVET